MELRKLSLSRNLGPAWIVLCLAFLPSCGDDDGTQPTPDATAPGPVDDLAVLDSAGGVITLIWTAPGDDGSEGQAARYDIRCSTTLASEAEWALAAVVDSSRVPKVAGEPESLEVAGLDDGAWYFALKTADEVPNWSSMSNIASVTLIDSIPPGQVTDLAAVVVTAVTVKLAWTAPGDDGAERAASAYDLRYALTPITDETWDDALPVESMPAPKAAGSLESHTVTGLEQATSYSFALKTIDNAGNESELSNVLSKSTASLVQLTFSPACDPPRCNAYEADWSPDGLAMAFSASWDEPFPRTELYMMAVSGGPAVRLTHEPDYARYPSWSPDRTQLAFISPHTIDIETIWIMDAAPGGSSTAVVSSTEQTQFIDCVWSPDGSRIAYLVAVVSEAPPQTYVAWEICTIGVQGEDPRLVFNDTEWIVGLDWSPDGSRIVFGSARGGNYDIWDISADGGTPERLTSDPADDYSPAWSPDGSQIAFSSKRSGNGEIWLMSSTGEDPTQLTFGPGSNSMQCWSPDGKGIAFLSREGDVADIWLLRWD